MHRTNALACYTRHICYSYIYNLTYRIENKGRATGFFYLHSQNKKSYLITNYHVLAGASPSSISITFQHCDAPVTGDQLFIDWVYDVFQKNQVCFVMLQWFACVHVHIHIHTCSVHT